MHQEVQKLREEVDKKLGDIQSELSTTQKCLDKVKTDVDAMKEFIGHQQESNKLMQEMHRAIVGSEEYKEPGLANRVANLESGEQNSPDLQQKPGLFNKDTLIIAVVVVGAITGNLDKILPLIGRY